VNVNRYVSLKPDVQYVINPGGAKTPDALVGLLRIEGVY
jgi:carbohydrate-selective porin OprB